jgi:DNA-binding transcriptional ArsR family regulator
MARPVIGDDPFRAISHPVRRKILDMLRDRPRTVGDIAAAFRLSLPSLSQHLAVLRDARLVQAKVKGRTLSYSIDPKPLHAITRWLRLHGK